MTAEAKPRATQLMAMTKRELIMLYAKRLEEHGMSQHYRPSSWLKDELIADIMDLEARATP